VKTLLAIFDSVDDAADTVVDITARAITPAACEMLDGWTLRAVEDYITRVSPWTARLFSSSKSKASLKPSLLSHRDHRSLQRASCREVRVARDTPSVTSSGKAARTLSARSAAWPPAITS